MTCWTSLVTVCRMKLFFQCSLLDMPGMSLSHHNTLYLKQPLLKATRFIPLRQLELPIGLLKCRCLLCLLREFGYGSGSRCSILWMVWLFVLPVLDVPAKVRLVAFGSGMIPTSACSFGTVGRSKRAFKKLAFQNARSEWMFFFFFFSNDIKLTYFLGLDTETFFPPNEKVFWELLWAQNGVWSHQKVDLPNSGSFFGWSKKGSGLTRLVGQVSFPSRILFFSERKRLCLSQILL